MREKTTLLLLLIIIVVLGLYSWRNTPTEAIKKQGPGSTNPTPIYLVSLGDSIGAGAGAGSPKTNASDQSALCWQSNKAYSAQVAKGKHLKLRQFACSGATIMAGILKPQVIDGKSFKPQLTAAEPYLKGSDVLISIGINDVNWMSMMQSCIASGCNVAGTQTIFRQNLSRLSTNLGSLLQTLASFHPHEVVLNTYYPLLNDTDTCLASHGMTAVNIRWANNLEADLNATIVSVSKKHRDVVVPIRFSGHRLCDSDPWIQNLNDSAPLHPTAAGQASMAQQDMNVLKTL